MTSPRIYIYKITFEEVPYFYYGVHREKKYGEYYMGSPVTNKWAWSIYTPKKQILQEFDSAEEAHEVEVRIIKYFLNKDPNCLNANAGGLFLYRSGEKHHSYGKKWWNNGVENVISSEFPGEGWMHGKIHRSNNYKRGKDSPNTEKTWWNNGEEEVFTKVKPGDSWIKGRVKSEYLYNKRPKLTKEHKKKLSKALKGKMAGDKNPMSKKNYSFTKEHKEKLRTNTRGRKWWNNGMENKLQINKPGPEWIRGMITKL
jgi:hypothetical protein